MQRNKLLLLLFLCGIFITNPAYVKAEDMVNTISFDHNLEGIVLQSKYDFPAFSLWRITSNKDVNMSISVINNPNNATILIEHLHADIFIESHKIGFDDITQDSMDDSIHGSIQSGFYISKEYPYYENFLIEGTSPEFTQMCSYAYSYWGYGESTAFKLSEHELTEHYGVYGQTLVCTYDILIKYENETLYHNIDFTDNIMINLEEESLQNNNDNFADEEPEEIPGYPITILSVGIIIGLFLVIKKNKLRKV